MDHEGAFTRFNNLSRLACENLVEFEQWWTGRHGVPIGLCDCRTPVWLHGGPTSCDTLSGAQSLVDWQLRARRHASAGGRDLRAAHHATASRPRAAHDGSTACERSTTAAD